MLNEKNEETSSHKTIIMFTNEEKALVDEIFRKVRALSDASYRRINRKLIDLKRVATSISKYPSIKSTSFLAGKTRDGESLVEALCALNPDSRLLSLPTKTILGKAYLVAKFHTFVAFTKVATKLELEKVYINTLHKITSNIMFTIMAEDVYVSLLSDGTLTENVKKEVAHSLTDLWENRLDKNSLEFSSILIALWNARTKIAPVFGTMLGTDEFFSFSNYVGPKWALFISKKLKIKEVAWALHEFLFGISYEEITLIRKKLVEEKLEVVSREEVFNMLKKRHDFEESDLRSFYVSYSERRSNAEARKRLKMDGPKIILEDYCVRSMFEDKEIWKEKKFII